MLNEVRVSRHKAHLAFKRNATAALHFCRNVSSQIGAVFCRIWHLKDSAGGKQLILSFIDISDTSSMSGVSRFGLRITHILYSTR